jgi:hypothetical protein
MVTMPSDISRYGCRYMAGNGFEWTRNLTEQKKGVVIQALSIERLVPLMLQEPLNKEEEKECKVQLRSAGFSQNNWFQFSNLPAPYNYFETDPDISFRVVVEIPLNALY